MPHKPPNQPSPASEHDPLAAIFGEQPTGPREPHPASLEDDDLLEQCVMKRDRTGGPGGQHRNKTETLVEFTHEPTGIAAHAGERRSPEVNRRVAIKRLRLALATHHRTEVPSGDVRSDLWRSRTKAGKINCSTKHHDYPTMLAEALDMLFACKLDPRKASTRLECTMSQLLKLVRNHPPALEAVNNARVERGMHTLK